ncbi:hypothetical protein ACLOJK_040121 [Asimina triloba]
MTNYKVGRRPRTLNIETTVGLVKQKKVELSVLAFCMEQYDSKSKRSMEIYVTLLFSRKAKTTTGDSFVAAVERNEKQAMLLAWKEAALAWKEAVMLKLMNRKMQEKREMAYLKMERQIRRYLEQSTCPIFLDEFSLRSSHGRHRLDPPVIDGGRGIREAVSHVRGRGKKEEGSPFMP